MRRSFWLGLAAALALVTAGAWLVGRAAGAAGPSTLGRQPAGWLAARLYLEARGATVSILDRPLEELEGGGVLVVSFPWQRTAFNEDLGPVRDHLRRGGTVLLGYADGDTLAELRFREAFDLGSLEVRDAPPLAPAAWWRYRRQEGHLVPTAPGAAPAVVTPPRAVPLAPLDARVLYRLEEAPPPPAGGEPGRPDGVPPGAAQGTPAVFTFPVGRGRVVALPSDALSNARFGQVGNADLLEGLLRELGESWTFDEYHHGLSRPGEGSDLKQGPSLAFDLFLIHLALLYGLALVTVARRFGPAWREQPVRMGSAGAFLLGLGELHHRLGHHGEAARLLVRRFRELEPRLPAPPEPSPDGAMDGPGLVELARKIARSRGPTPAPGRETTSHE